MSYYESVFWLHSRTDLELQQALRRQSRRLGTARLREGAGQAALGFPSCAGRVRVNMAGCLTAARKVR